MPILLQACPDFTDINHLVFGVKYLVFLFLEGHHMLTHSLQIMELQILLCPSEVSRVNTNVVRRIL